MSKTILIIDDEEMARTLLRLMLKRAGYNVLEADDGLIGLDMALSHEPDAIILDIMMPVMDGYEVLQRLRSEDATVDIPIILLSANMRVTGVERGISLGATRCLGKPLSPKNLEKVLAEILADEDVSEAVW